MPWTCFLTATIMRPSGLGATMEVGDWLRSLDLGQYEASFRDNAIDVAVLPKLTADDLKELGVVVVGHRRKIISAIEELNVASASRVEGVKPVPTTSPVPVGLAPDAAERRQLTVMFCDLVGSTPMSVRLDPEDMRQVIRVYQNTVAGEVTRFEGHDADRSPLMPALRRRLGKAGRSIASRASRNRATRDYGQR
jgi:hypothetical protein